MNEQRVSGTSFGPSNDRSFSEISRRE